MSAIDESAFAPIIQDFVKAYNSRWPRKIHNHSTWIRITPPDSLDFDTLKQDPNFLPFIVVGSLGEVWDICNDYVTIRVGSDSFMYHRSVFLETFIRAIDHKKKF